MNLIHPLIDDSKCDSALVESVLAEIGFENSAAAFSRFQKLCQSDEQRSLLNVRLPILLNALEQAANPDSSLLNFSRFVEAVPDRVSLFARLADTPRAIEILVKLFVNSQFLAEILIRNPGYLERITASRRVAEFKSREEFIADGLRELDNATSLEGIGSGLRRYQQWELLRIAACDTFGLMDLKNVTLQLSLLADAIVELGLRTLARDEGVSIDHFAVLAFGKLGGEELNYSSDIDLVFVAEEKAEQYWSLGQKLIRLLSENTPDGFLYRVDMRLRPWGQAGPLVTTCENYVDYVRKSAEFWEKQALLKARCIAGDGKLGKECLGNLSPYLWTTDSQQVRDRVLGMKDKIEAELRRRRLLDGEIKGGIGGIRDIEFTVQALQMIHGGKTFHLQTANTLEGIIRLAEFDILNAEEYRCLTTGYVFLRTVEHALQLMHNQQTHRIPDSPRERNYLANRLDFAEDRRFLDQVQNYTTAVRKVFDRQLRPPAESPTRSETGQLPEDQHFGQAANSYRQTFSPPSIRAHLKMLSDLSEERPIRVAARNVEANQYEVTVVGYDRLGDLSAICGIICAAGLDITHGDVFTGAEVERSTFPGTTSARHKHQGRKDRKFVNVFLVQPVPGSTHVSLSPDWPALEDELATCLKDRENANRTERFGRLARRVVESVSHQHTPDKNLMPLEIRILDGSSDAGTTLEIRGNDTPGFLYELTNATALNGLSVVRMSIRSQGKQVRDLITVVDAHTHRPPDPARLQKLLVAIVLVKHFTHLLAQAPNPVQSLKHFRELLEGLNARPDWADQLIPLHNSDVLSRLAKLLGVSDFLWEDFLRVQHQELFAMLTDLSVLESAKDRTILAIELHDELAEVQPDDYKDVLNAFKDREMLRVDLRHILGIQTAFRTFSQELTAVAEATIEGALSICWEKLTREYGIPFLPSGEPCHICVVGLGKLGGREMGYASDIELMFLYDQDGETRGNRVISNHQFFEQLVQQFRKLISTKRQGIFEVDLRLRPYGNAGPYAVTLEAFQKYFGTGGDAWPYERQALVKLRWVAGDLSLGDRVIELRNEILYRGEAFDVRSMQAMRERQIRQLTHAGTFNAKLSPGAAVDCEYFVQALQITFGHLSPELRSTNTREALKALETFGILPQQERLQLRDAYRFFRRVIDGLRVVRGNAADLNVPPLDTEEFLYLARRLGYGPKTEKLSEDLNNQAQRVVEITGQLETIQSQAQPKG